MKLGMTNLHSIYIIPDKKNVPHPSWGEDTVRSKVNHIYIWLSGSRADGNQQFGLR